MTRSHRVALLLLAGLGACTPQAPPENAAPTPTATAAEPIISGSPDAVHDAVVAVLMNDALCTGTIIGVDGQFGYVLTAAHCVDPNDPPVQIVISPDINNPRGAIAFQVTGSAPDPRYNGETYDFGMVQFQGADPSTPVIQALTPQEDNLRARDQVEFVGYGLDENNQTGVRLHVVSQISRLTDLTMDYTQDNGGPCEGDSGGPALVTVNGQERVAGVTSYGDQNCQFQGTSGRNSAVYDDFILPFMQGQVPNPAPTCDTCFGGVTSGQGACMDAVNACFNDQSCNAFVSCIQNCNNQACQDQCVSANQAGVALYQAVLTCGCQACANECAQECGGGGGGGGSCGFQADGACGTCLESSCCDEGAACANDPTCTDCFSGNGSAACDSNQPAQDFAGCLQTNCQDSCIDPAPDAGVVDEPDVGGGGQPGDPDAGGSPDPIDQGNTPLLTPDAEGTAPRLDASGNGPLPIADGGGSLNPSLDGGTTAAAGGGGGGGTAACTAAPGRPVGTGALAALLVAAGGLGGARRRRR